MTKPSRCLVPGCNGPHKAHGRCRRHYATARARELALRACRHCGHTPAPRPGCSCHRCYDSLHIGRVSAADAEGDFYGPAALPEPTGQPPGPGKVAVLAGRAERRLSLFHRDDEPLDLG